MEKSLAVKYRPKTFDDVIEQDAVKIILKQQLESGTIHQAMLFCGPSGDGKTTTARIVANMLNEGKGLPIEMDAASHNGVDDVRDIIKMASSQAIDGATYKVFIIDECHSLSNTGWQAFLKCIEEPPARAVFIFCTTDPQKLPATILSRVQRFQFQKVSTEDIVNRLEAIIASEGEESPIEYDKSAIQFIAKLADGGVRLAIQYLEKCLAYDNNITTENVVKALNVTNYEDYIGITNLLLDPSDRASLVIRLDEIYASGVDFKQFLKQYVSFILDVNKTLILDDLNEAFKYINLPRTKEIERWLKAQDNLDFYNQLLRHLVKLDADVKYSQNPKVDIEAGLLLFETNV